MIQKQNFDSPNVFLELERQIQAMSGMPVLRWGQADTVHKVSGAKGKEGQQRVFSCRAYLGGPNGGPATQEAVASFCEVLGQAFELLAEASPYGRRFTVMPRTGQACLAMKSGEPFTPQHLLSALRAAGKESEIVLALNDDLREQKRKGEVHSARSNEDGTITLTVAPGTSREMLLPIFGFLSKEEVERVDGEEEVEITVSRAPLVRWVEAKHGGGFFCPPLLSPGRVTQAQVQETLEAALVHVLVEHQSTSLRLRGAGQRIDYDPEKRIVSRIVYEIGGKLHEEEIPLEGIAIDLEVLNALARQAWEALQERMREEGWESRLSPLERAEAAAKLFEKKSRSHTLREVWLGKEGEVIGSALDLQTGAENVLTLASPETSPKRGWFR